MFKDKSKITRHNKNYNSSKNFKVQKKKLCRLETVTINQYMACFHQQTHSVKHKKKKKKKTHTHTHTHIPHENS